MGTDNKDYKKPGQTTTNTPGQNTQRPNINTGANQGQQGKGGLGGQTRPGSTTGGTTGTDTRTGGGTTGGRGGKV